MAQEENQRYSNSSSGGACVGGRPCKKMKQKKVPQRGLGVAQLEKIRLEEQQKKEAVASGGGGGTVVASSSSSSSPLIFLPLPQQPFSSIPFQPPPSPPDLSGFRPNLDLLVPPPPPPSKAALYGHNVCNNQPNGVRVGVGSSIGGLAGTLPRNGYFPSMWNHYDFDGDGPKLDPGFGFQPHLLSDFRQISPPSVMMQRIPHTKPPPQHQQQPHHHQQQQQPPPPRLNVNISSLYSSVPNCQMEPPSNQSCYSNYSLPLLPDEEKMVGMKRPWPFSLDNPPGPSMQCHLPQFVPPICRLDEPSSCGNASMFNFEPGNPIFGDGSLPSTSCQLDWRGGLSDLNPKKINKENGSLDTLLTLGRPAANSLPASKAKKPIQFPSPRYPEFSEFSMLPYQRYIDDPFFGLGGSVQPQPFYSFLPSKGQVTHSETNSNDRRSEISDYVDLNLKL